MNFFLAVNRLHFQKNLPILSELLHFLILLKKEIFWNFSKKNNIQKKENFFHQNSQKKSKSSLSWRNFLNLKIFQNFSIRTSQIGFRWSRKKKFFLISLKSINEWKKNLDSVQFEKKFLSVKSVMVFRTIKIGISDVNFFQVLFFSNSFKKFKPLWICQKLLIFDGKKNSRIFKNFQAKIFC